MSPCPEQVAEEQLVPSKLLNAEYLYLGIPHPKRRQFSSLDSSSGALHRV
jgi:hypothetical protein